MSEQREDDELKELTFTVKVKVQVRADLPEEGLRVEGAELHLVRGEGASKAYPQTRVSGRWHGVLPEVWRKPVATWQSLVSTKQP